MAGVGLGGRVEVALGHVVTHRYRALQAQGESRAVTCGARGPQSPRAQMRKRKPVPICRSANFHQMPCLQLGPWPRTWHQPLPLD